MNLSFRIDATGLAHACRGGSNLGICGADTRQAAPAEGRPCQRCLDTAAHLATAPTIDPLAELRAAA
jgi:hypothetical protein